MPRVLAVTLDGILQPIGYSQVARIALALAHAGVPYAIASLERARDLADADHVRRVRTVLEDAGVPWKSAVFVEGGGPTAIGRNLARLTSVARELARRSDAHLVHARAVPGGLVARALLATSRLPYVFDARAYWVDEQVEEGRRFTSPLVFSAAKALEREVFSAASAIVTLTALQADDVRAGRLGPHRRDRPIEVIPTCADYTAFRLAEPGSAAPRDLDRFARGAPIVSIVGALNRSYDAAATARFAAAMLNESADLRLVVLTQQRREHEDLLARAEVPRVRTLITSVPHEEMPMWLPHFDWGLLLLRSPFAKRASMPTKLAEFFASGVRPIQHGCNTEVSQWVERARSGTVLQTVDDAELRATARRIVRSSTNAGDLARAREITAPHFSLASAVERYRRVLASTR